MKKESIGIYAIESEEDKRYEELVNIAKSIIKELKKHVVTRGEKNIVFELIDEFSEDFIF